MYFNISYNFSRKDIHTAIARQIQLKKPGYICVADGNVLQEVHRSRQYRDIINGALFSICDSSWVPVFLRQLYGIEVKQYCGSNIFRDITGSGEYRQCFLGATSEVLDSLREKLSETNPSYTGMMFHDLPFVSAEEFDYPAIARQIEEDGSDIIWVSLGAPKQEIFASELKKHLTKGIIIPVGAVFNFFSGVGAGRAPEWMIRHHLEFIYRLFNEPAKQAGRCLKILTALPGIILEEKERVDCDYSLFVQLLQVSTGKRSSLECTPDRRQWAGICRLAGKQSLLGIICDAAMSLPEYQQPPKKPKLYLGFQSEAIQKRNGEMNSHTSEIVGKLQALGLECCILKGQGVAELYPSPLLRQSGDIDVWVTGDPDNTLQSIDRVWEISEVFYHHTGITPFDDGTEVEIHFRPSWMNNPSANRKLQRYFNSCSGFDTSGPFPKPSLSFDCVFSAIHICRHLLFEGVGIRQLMDYHYILKNSTVKDREDAFTFMKSLKLERFLGALMYAEGFFFQLEKDKLLCAPDKAYGEFLVKEVMKSGNFGTGDSSNRSHGNGTLLKRAVSRMSRLIRFAGIVPSEVFWAPAFKAWQYLRIKKRGYSITPTS